jgi:uncharacterized protein involved in exopolysaccharide biosynthesis
MRSHRTQKGPRTLADYRAVVQRRWRILVIGFVALAAGAVAAVAMAKPFYEAQLKLLVKQDRTDSVITTASNPDTSRSAVTENDVLSQAELIKSDDLLERVASESGLTSQVIASGEATSDTEAAAVAARTLRDDLRVVPVKRTWLIDVSYHAPDQRTALHVLETLARLYLEKHLTLHRPTGIYRFFSEQTELAKEELQNAQDRLIKFGRENGVISASLERQSILQKVMEFDALRAQAAAAHLEATQRLSAVRKELRTVPARKVAEVRTSDDAGVIRDIQNRILSLETRRTDLLRKFTPRYRGVVEVDAQLQEARAALAAARQTPLTEETLAANPAREWLDTERARIIAENAAARARMQAFASTADRYRNQAQLLDARNAEEHDLVLQLEGAEQKYLLYAQKAEEARISDELDRMHIANVVVAQAPKVDYQARRTPSLAMLPLLLIVSLLLSFCGAVVTDIVDPKVTYGLATTTALEVLHTDYDSPPSALAHGFAPAISVAQRFSSAAMRVRAVEVAIDVPETDIAVEAYEHRQREGVIAKPPPGPPRKQLKPVSLEELFGLSGPRRLTS